MYALDLQKSFSYKGILSHAKKKLKAHWGDGIVVRLGAPCRSEAKLREIQKPNVKVNSVLFVRLIALIVCLNCPSLESPRLIQESA